MLSCIIGNKSINSFDYEEVKLREWSNKEMLRCPECNERVIYCKGDYKIPYFKHEVGSECEGNIYYEPMTNEHIEGIRSLYNRLKEIDGIENLEVEKYIKNTRQRPDIYFEYDNQRYCIEYQCSPISTQYNKRHELYELEGIKDIWILGFENFYIEAIDDLINKKEKELESSIDSFYNSIIKKKLEEYLKMKEEKSVIFKRKRVKSIEDEINYSEYPLIYYSHKVDYLYKATDVFTLNNKKTIMTQTSEVILKMINIADIQFEDMVIKTNLPMNTNFNKLKYLLKYRNNDIRILSEKYNGLYLDYSMYNDSIKYLEYKYIIKYGFNNNVRICFEDNSIEELLSLIDDFIYNSNKLYNKNKSKIDDYIIIGKYYKLILSTIKRYNNKVRKIKDKKLHIKVDFNTEANKIDIFEETVSFKISIYPNYMEFNGTKYNVDEFTLENKLSKSISDEIRRIRYGRV